MRNKRSVDWMLEDERPFRTSYVLAATVVLAAALRVIGLEYGLPAVYNPDEVAIMNRALGFATWDFNPHNFLYPSFYFYVLFGWVGAFFVAGRAAGVFDTLTAFQNQFFIDPTGVYLAGRALGVFCGALTVVATYWLGRKLYGRTAGLAAALFMATAPLAVRDSHYVKHDVPVSLLIVLAYLAITGIWSPAATDGSQRGRAMLAGAFCGVAFSTHYYTIFLALPLAYALFTRHGSSGAMVVVRDLLLAGLMAAAVFFLLSPFILVEPATAWRDIVANRRIVVDRALGTTGTAFANSGAYVRMLAFDALGSPVAILALAGACWSLVATRHRGILLLAFPVAFLAFISNTVPASRYLNPVLPSCAVLAGFVVSRLSHSVGTSSHHMVAGLLSLAACVPGIADSIRTDLFIRKTDTRTLALRYIESHVPAGSTLLVQPYSVPLAQSRESLIESLQANLGDVSRASTKFAMRLALADEIEPTYRTLFLGDGGLDADKIYVSYGDVGGSAGLAALISQRVQYVIVKRYNRPDKETLPLLDALAREGRRIAVFSPYRPEARPERVRTVEPFLHNTDARMNAILERPGPVIEIWSLNAYRQLRP